MHWKQLERKGVKEMTQLYLGDGVYAKFDGYMIWIWTSDGVHESEKIAIEPFVFKALIEFARDSWGDL